MGADHVDLIRRDSSPLNGDDIVAPGVVVEEGHVGQAERSKGRAIDSAAAKPPCPVWRLLPNASRILTTSRRSVRRSTWSTRTRSAIRLLREADAEAARSAARRESGDRGWEGSGTTSTRSSARRRARSRTAVEGPRQSTRRSLDRLALPPPSAGRRCVRTRSRDARGPSTCRVHAGERGPSRPRGGVPSTRTAEPPTTRTGASVVASPDLRHGKTNEQRMRSAAASGRKEKPQEDQSHNGRRRPRRMPGT